MSNIQYMGIIASALGLLVLTSCNQTESIAEVMISPCDIAKLKLEQVNLDSKFLRCTTVGMEECSAHGYSVGFFSPCTDAYVKQCRDFIAEYEKTLRAIEKEACK